MVYCIYILVICIKANAQGALSVPVGFQGSLRCCVRHLRMSVKYSTFRNLLMLVAHPFIYCWRITIAKTKQLI